jgi:hypothetical protein
MRTHIEVDRWRQKTHSPPGWACRACQKRTQWPWQSPTCQPSVAGATQSPPACTLKRRPGNSAPISPWLPGTPQPAAQPKTILKETEKVNFFAGTQIEYLPVTPFATVLIHGADALLFPGLQPGKQPQGISRQPPAAIAPGQHRAGHVPTL